MSFLRFTWATLIHYIFLSLKLKRITCHEAKHTKWIKLEKASNIICQNDLLTMQCPNYESIYILPNAFWGRDDNVTCQQPRMPNGKNCSSTKMCIPDDKDMDDIRIREACHKEQYCVLIANNIFFRFARDICPDVCKYVRLNYECRQMSGMKRSLADHKVNWIGKLKKLIGL